MKRIELLLSAPLLFGFALLAAPAAQATTSGCFYPAFAGEIAFYEVEYYAHDLSENGYDEGTCKNLARDLHAACRNVGATQVECLQKLKRGFKVAGRDACAGYEEVDREECLNQVADDAEFFDWLISEVDTEMREHCMEQRVEFTVDVCSNGQVVP